jgi:hypothetical protein
VTCRTTTTVSVAIPATILIPSTSSMCCCRATSMVKVGENLIVNNILILKCHLRKFQEVVTLVDTMMLDSPAVAGALWTLGKIYSSVVVEFTRDRSISWRTCVGKKNGSFFSSRDKLYLSSRYTYISICSDCGNGNTLHIPVWETGYCIPKHSVIPRT